MLGVSIKRPIGPLSATGLAPSPSLLGDRGVGCGIFVTFRAMCFRFLSNSISLAAKEQPLFKYSFFGVDKLLVGKPMLSPLDNGVSFQARYLGKLASLISNTICNNYSCVRFIPRLFLSTGPLAVIRIVSLVVVDSFNRVFHWPIAHICDKVCEANAERQKPILADSNSSASISVVLPKFRVMTPSLHSSPNRIVRMICSKRHNASNNLTSSVPVMVTGG